MHYVKVQSQRSKFIFIHVYLSLLSTEKTKVYAAMRDHEHLRRIVLLLRDCDHIDITRA